MKPHSRAGVVVTAVSLTVTFLTVCAPSAGAAQASPAVASSSWAYGAVRTITVTGQSGTYVYDASATAGFAVILNETTVSLGNFSVSVHRTMGVILSVRYCHPTCSSPIDTATVHFHKWEILNATLNLTTAANVTSGERSFRALGLASSALGVTVGLRLSTVVSVDGVVASTRNLSVNLDANASSTFDPALGLLPLNLSQVTSWTATSGFNETGLAHWSLSDVRVGGTLAGTVQRSGSLNLNQSGSVTLSGNNSKTTIRLGGTSYDVLNLSVAKGPFDLREGFLLVPSGSDLFGTSVPAWLATNATGTGSANVSQANIDVANSVSGSGHLGFGGSGLWLRSATSNPAAATGVAGTGLEPAVVPSATGSNATYLQGAPESLHQATTDQNCLANGVGCPAASSSRSLLGELLVLGGVGAAVVIAAAVITTRRRVPPPAYPNASLYPPGPASSAPSGPNRPVGPPPAPAEDDPLGHLW